MNTETKRKAGRPRKTTQTDINKVAPGELYAWGSDLPEKYPTALGIKHGFVHSVEAVDVYGIEIEVGNFVVLKGKNGASVAKVVALGEMANSIRVRFYNDREVTWNNSSQTVCLLPDGWLA